MDQQLAYFEADYNSLVTELEDIKKQSIGKNRKERQQLSFPVRLRLQRLLDEVSMYRYERHEPERFITPLGNPGGAAKLMINIENEVKRCDSL